MLIFNKLYLDHPLSDIFSGVPAADIALTIAPIVSEAAAEQVLKSTY